MKRSTVRFLLAIVFVGLWATAAILTPGARGQGPDRSHPPEIGPAPSLKLPPIQHLKLKNGLPVVLMEKHDVPLLQVNLVIRAGSVMDPNGKAGLANLAATMLTDGAGARDALMLADAIDYLGARLAAAAGFHTTGVSLFTPLSKLDSSLALLGDVIQRPTFPPAELERRKKERLTTLLQWRDSPAALSSVTFNQVLFRTHPYGAMTMGDEKSIRSTAVDDLKMFHAMYYRPNNATAIVVGDVTPAAILPRLEAVFGGWVAQDVVLPSVSDAEQVTSRAITLVDKVGAAQTEIRIGCLGAARLTEDYYAIVVMNTLLGGSFTSRLNNNLREQHGYTYGARSMFAFRPLRGPFFAGAAVQTDVTDSALVEFLKELSRIQTPVPDEELLRAKNYVALGFPGDFQTVSQIAGKLEELVTYNLPDDYFNTYIGKILAVTQDDVQRVSKKYIDPERLAITLVGDRKSIEARVNALRLGPIQPKSVDDILGKAPAL